MSWAFRAWHLDLNLTNRPVRTRMPGGVGGAAEHCLVPLSRLLLSNQVGVDHKDYVVCFQYGHLFGELLMIQIKMNRRIKIKIVVGVVILLASALVWLGCIEVTNYPPTPENLHSGQYRANTVVTPPDSLIVASYNIYLSEDIDLAIADLRGNPQLAGADILLLQEMDPDGADRIARALQMDFVYWPSFKFASTGRLFGNAILSRFPMASASVLDISHSRLEKRGALTAKESRALMTFYREGLQGYTYLE